MSLKQGYNWYPLDVLKANFTSVGSIIVYRNLITYMILTKSKGKQNIFFCCLNNLFDDSISIMKIKLKDQIW